MPPLQLSSSLLGCVGYRYSGLPPGTHLGLPSPSLTVVISLGPQTKLASMPDPRQRPAAFDVLVGGLHSRPAVLAHDGEMFGIQLDLTPAGARSLLGLPAGELGGAVVALEKVVGRPAADRFEAVREARTWPERFAMVYRVLSARLGCLQPAPTQLGEGWRLIVSEEAPPRVSEVASTVGWSRRHFQESYLAEFGVSPKQLDRIARFNRSKQLLQRSPSANLAEVAATCGYCDQSHLAREWNHLAGCAPSRWLRTEELSFIQDGAPTSAPGLTA